MLVKQETTLLKNISGAPLYDRLLNLPTNNRLGRKGLPGTNALTYYEKSQITAVKRFIILCPGIDFNQSRYASIPFKFSTQTLMFLRHNWNLVFNKLQPLSNPSEATQAWKLIKLLIVEYVLTLKNICNVKCLCRKSIAINLLYSE